MQPVHLHNSLTGRVEQLQPIQPPRVSLYVCGPTIYNFAHIGNFRTYVVTDLLQRILRFRGYEVDHVMQYTDVDDKTIGGARAQGRSLADYTTTYQEAFIADAQDLNVQLPARTPRATEHIPAMVAMIETLLEKGHAYAADGSIYFRIDSIPQYGCLCHFDPLKMRLGTSNDGETKEGINDFVLWKASTPCDGPIGWESPWGRGRPGWHIECSAISTSLLGPQLDIHAGGVDLKFPHHENEIAQSEAVTGQPFVRTWFHVEHLLVDGKKMAKSDKNYFTVRDVLAKGYTGEELRFALLTGAHYAKNLNFTWAGMDTARASLTRIRDWEARMLKLAGDRIGTKPHKFYPSMFDKLAQDLNVNGMLGQLFNHITISNYAVEREQLSPEQAADILYGWRQLSGLMGLLPPAKVEYPAEITALLGQRQTVRAKKNFKESDQLRDELLQLGWKVKDTADGQELTKLV